MSIDYFSIGYISIMRDEIQTSGGLGFILLESRSRRFIHTVPAQYTLITDR